MMRCLPASWCRLLLVGAWAPLLPAQRGPAEDPVVRAVQHRTLTAVRVDVKREVQTLPVEYPEAVADPV